MTKIVLTSVIDLAAQRVSFHELLFALVETGAMPKERAAAVAFTTAEKLRELDVEKSVEGYREQLARGYEQIAGAMLGHPPVS